MIKKFLIVTGFANRPFEIRFEISFELSFEGKTDVK